MAYGGLLVQWLMHANHRFGLNATGLLGAGGRHLRLPVSRLIARGDLRGRSTRPARGARCHEHHRPFREDFFVAEPEADALVG